jgi:hypothetical protein
MLASAQPGDLFATQGGGEGGAAIEAGAILKKHPAVGHIAGFHHWQGTVPWGIEGRPGGVGWVDMRKYFSNPLTIHNIAQEKSKSQRYEIKQLSVKMLGTPYDWQAIQLDAASLIHLQEILQLFEQPVAELKHWDWDKNGVPGHVVCSSLYAWEYGRLTPPLAEPNTPARFTWPDDWASFWLDSLHLAQ